MTELHKEIVRKNISDDAREFLLTFHALGLAVAGIGFMYDWASGHMTLSKVYSPLQEHTWLAIIWSSGPFCSAGILLIGILLRHWKIQTIGCVSMGGWYLLQVAIFVVAAQQGNITLIGPILIYGALLFPTILIHAISVANFNKIEKGAI